MVISRLVLLGLALLLGGCSYIEEVGAGSKVPDVKPILFGDRAHIGLSPPRFKEGSEGTPYQAVAFLSAEPPEGVKGEREPGEDRVSGDTTASSAQTIWNEHPEVGIVRIRAWIRFESPTFASNDYELTLLGSGVMIEPESE